MPKWTIGIPCFDQPGTLWATITALRCMHAEQMRDCEILVVNDNPRSALGKLISEEVPKMSGNDCRVRCVESLDRSGTYSARNRVFDEAEGEFVLCLDSHVVVALGGLASLFKHFDVDPLSRDLVSGPVMYSSLKHCGTHYQDGFRRGMFGKWGTDPRANHRVPMNELPGGEPFEIPSMGIGLFACRRETFPRFHDAFRGFGGGEWYLHEKNRRQGGRSICLPDLRWPHYFWKEPKPYSPVWYDRVRNEVIGRQEFGESIDLVYDHFVAGEKQYISQKDWDWLIADPIANEKPDCGGCRKKKAGTPPENLPAAPKTHPSKNATGLSNATTGENLESLYRTAAETTSDINRHLPKLRELSSRSQSVVELGVRRGVSTTALLAGQPQRMTAFDLRFDPVVERLAAVAGKTEFRFVQGDSREVEIPDCDLLFIDTIHTAEQLAAELERHSGRVRRWIAMHDTQTFGEVGQGGGSGLLVALRSFLLQAPEWSVVYHSIENNGLTVISRDDRDKPKLPGTMTLVGNLGKAMIAYAASGLQDRTTEQVRACLEVCATCETRRGVRCSACGCPVDERARMAANPCPLGKWPQ